MSATPDPTPSTQQEPEKSIKVNVGPSYNRERYNTRYVDSFDPRDTQRIPIEYQDPSSIALLTKYFGPDAHDYSEMTEDEQGALMEIIQRRIDTLKTTFRIFPPNSLKNISYGTKIQKMETLLKEIEERRQLRPAPSAEQLAAQAAAERAAAAAGAVAGAAGRLLPRLPAAELIENTFHAAYILLDRAKDNSRRLEEIRNNWDQEKGEINRITLGELLESVVGPGPTEPDPNSVLATAYSVFTIQEQLGINRTGDAQTRLKQGYASTFSRLYTEIVKKPVNNDISGQIEALYANEQNTIPSASTLGTLLKNLLQNPNTPLPAPLRGILEPTTATPAVPSGTPPPPGGGGAAAPPPSPLSPQEKAVFLTSALLIKQYIAENSPQ